MMNTIDLTDIICMWHLHSRPLHVVMVLKHQRALPTVVSTVSEKACVCALLRVGPTGFPFCFSFIQDTAKS